MEQPHFIVFHALDYTISVELVKLLFMFHYRVCFMYMTVWFDETQQIFFILTFQFLYPNIYLNTCIWTLGHLKKLLNYNFAGKNKNPIRTSDNHACSLFIWTDQSRLSACSFSNSWFDEIMKLLGNVRLDKLMSSSISSFICIHTQSRVPKHQATSR